MAPYSCTTARAPRTKAQIICVRSKENVIVFQLPYDVNTGTKTKLTENFLAFPSVKAAVKFDRLLVSRSLFFREIYTTSIFAAVRHKFGKSENKRLYKPYFFVFKIRIPLDAMCSENFERFHRGKFKKIKNKALKK